MVWIGFSWFRILSCCESGNEPMDSGFSQYLSNCQRFTDSHSRWIQLIPVGLTNPFYSLAVGHIEIWNFSKTALYSDMNAQELLPDMSTSLHVLALPNYTLCPLSTSTDCLRVDYGNLTTSLVKVHLVFSAVRLSGWAVSHTPFFHFICSPCVIIQLGIVSLVGIAVFILTRRHKFCLFYQAACSELLNITTCTTQRCSCIVHIIQT